MQVWLGPAEGHDARADQAAMCRDMHQLLESDHVIGTPPVPGWASTDAPVTYVQQYIAIPSGCSMSSTNA